eukprot:SAG31_NODE_35086_length_326_cov_0.995595_1_plen_37_part_01
MYSMYDGLPLYEKHVVVTVAAGAPNPVVVDALMTDTL